ncbi:MAG TPA: AarF/ABC1/UbiB kinase family protein [Blastocatellia bacterium]|jgi:predicted unusual protein kinase regulating ubiquinone biosynthesis (AarF/ABC1/UbiB family)|nr:AarF/ABC1/UbiB kinase family protein [Blastocatellia bacterium]
MNSKGKISRALRRLYVFWTLFSFALYVYLDSRGWVRHGEGRRGERLRVQARKLRDRLVKLGPTFIKIGQMLGTRADLLPIEYVDELSFLQDRVPAFSNPLAMATIESELSLPLAEIFAHIDEQPLASASLGQVYRATLLSGEEVAVKVQRPLLQESVAYDLELLRWIGGLLDRFPKLLPGVEWFGAIDEFDRVIHEEMDYRREASSAEEFARNFRDWPSIKVPRIYREFSSGRVLVMEFISGTKINDLERLRAEGLDPRAINELLYRAYFKQLLEDGFFHADPHPGNLLVMRDGRLAVFDFGMVGRISGELQKSMINAFFHLYNRDVNAIVDDLIGLGFLAPHADISSFRSIVAEVFSRKLDLKLSEVRFKDLTYDLAPIMYEYPITTPAQFTYLIRALMTLEGVSIVMNPDFNFFDVARPYVKDFIFRRGSSQLRRMALDSLRDAGTGRFELSRLWNMARMAYSLYFG